MVPFRVTPSMRPAKVSTTDPTRTGAARRPGRDSMNASFWAWPRMPRTSVSGLTRRTSTAPSGQRATAGCTRGLRYSSETVMCGLLSTSRLMKSRSEPRIKDDTARKNATPSTMPTSETSVGRLRLTRWVTAISSWIDTDQPALALGFGSGIARARRPSRKPAAGRTTMVSLSARPDRISVRVSPPIPA